MSLKLKIFNFFIQIFAKLIGTVRRGRLLAFVCEALQPIYTAKYDDKKLYYLIPNRLTHWRADTLFTKEPETIDWINGFGDNDIFYDVGANVGLYSIYAGVQKPKVDIHSFEPLHSNYRILNENILLNNLQENISAYCFALSDEHIIDKIYVPHTNTGGAFVNFGDNVSFDKKKFIPKFKQAMISFSLDQLIENYNIPVPNHVKIDVDGLEEKIIKGSLKLLKNSNLKSILIELNDAIEHDKWIKDTLIENGFVVHLKKQTDGLQGTRCSDVYNYIFTRKST